MDPILNEIFDAQVRIDKALSTIEANGTGTGSTGNGGVFTMADAVQVRDGLLVIADRAERLAGIIPVTQG